MLPDILEDAGSQSPVPPDAELLKVDTCLSVGALSLKFDMAELWRFGPDTSKSGSGKAREVRGGAGGASGAAGGGNVKAHCEHVYTMPATLKTYSGRIIGMWNSGFDDSRAPQHHVLSPQVRVGRGGEEDSSSKSRRQQWAQQRCEERGWEGLESYTRVSGQQHMRSSHLRKYSSPSIRGHVGSGEGI